MSRLRCIAARFSILTLALTAHALLAQPKFAAAAKSVAPITTATKAQKAWVERTLKHLSLEEKIGQMIEVRGIMGFYAADDPAFQRLIADIRKYHLGAVHLTVNTDGPLLLRAEPYEAAMTVRRLQLEASGKVPLIFSVDFERGPSMRLSAVEYFPHPMAFGAAHNPAYVQQWAHIVAEESRSLGIAWNYFPIADVQINPNNPIINTRSFGEDPVQVGDLVAAYIRGSHAGGMLTTLKHFPGHGDTDTDSHLQLSRVNADMQRLNAVELPPFRKGIAADSDAVMIAHVAFPAIEPDPTKIATTSHKVVTGLLREQMGFQGVIVSDAMEMQGLTKLYPAGSANPAGRAAVDAVKAGQDFIELPSDLEGTYTGLLQAVKSGEIPQTQIDASVRRLLLVKAKTGLNTPKEQLVDLDQVKDHVGKPSSYALAQQVAEHAITLVRDDNHLLPLKHDDGKSTLVLLFVSDPHGDEGRVLEQQIRARMPGATVAYIDRRSAPLEAQGIVAMLPRFTHVIAAIYTTPQPGQPGSQTSLETLSATKRKIAGTVLQSVLDHAGDHTLVLAMGSPYPILSYPGIRTYLCAFSSVSTSEAAMVRALFAEIPIHGKLPVTLPHIAQLGDGIDVDASGTPEQPPR